MEKDILFLLAVLGGVIGLVSFFLTNFQRKTTSQLQSDVELLKKQMSLFWGIVEKEIGNMLHSPHREELDKLIEKNISREELTSVELERFSYLLQQLTEDKGTTNGEKAAAVLLRAALMARHVET